LWLIPGLLRKNVGSEEADGTNAEEPVGEGTLENITLSQERRGVEKYTGECGIEMYVLDRESRRQVVVRYLVR
jgi:hypothetical protein